MYATASDAIACGARPPRNYVTRVRRIAERVEMYARTADQFTAAGDEKRAARYRHFAEIAAAQAQSNATWAYRYGI
jgi:hypothetical protein